MVEDKFADEKLTDEQLDGVVGGTTNEYYKDWSFFKALGVYCDSRTKSESEFAKYGVKCTTWDVSDNEYRMAGANGDPNQKHPRIAALGYVLAKSGYPGYNGKWWDIPYTENFIRNNVSSDAV